MIENLLKDLKENQIRICYSFYGNERYLTDYYLQKLQEAVVPEKIEGLNYDYYTYREVSLFQILNAANTIPFLGEKKLLVIREAELISKEKQLPAAALDAFEEYLNNPNPSAVVVFLGEEDLKGLAKSKVAMLLKKSGSARLIEFKKLKGADLRRYVKDNLKLKGLQASDEIVEILVLVGEKGLYNLQNELEKLFLGSRDGKVTLEQAEDLISYIPEARIFELIDAVIGRKGKNALALLDEYLAANEPPIVLRSMLISSFRRMIIIKDAMEAGHMKQVFRDYLDTSSDFLINKSINQVRNVSLRELLAVYEELHRLQFLSSSNKQDQKALIKDFIIKMSF